MIKVKYTITVIKGEDPRDWEAGRDCDMIDAIREYLKQDIGYILDGIDETSVVTAELL